MLYAVSVVTTGTCRHRGRDPVPLGIRTGQPRGAREQSARRVSRPLRQSGHRRQLRDRGGVRRRQRRLRADGAAPHRPAIRLLDHVGRVRLRRRARGLPERRRGVCRLAGARTGALLLQPVSAQHLAARARPVPARRDPVPAARHRLALGRAAAQEDRPAMADARRGQAEARSDAGAFRAQARTSDLARSSPPTT